MKPPFVRITARCETHGVFVVERKPNKSLRTGDRSGSDPSPFYQAVVCQKCRIWGTITQQELILPDAPPVVEQGEMFAEGACHG